MGLEHAFENERVNIKVLSYIANQDSDECGKFYQISYEYDSQTSCYSREKIVRSENITLSTEGINIKEIPVIFNGLKNSIVILKLYGGHLYKVNIFNNDGSVKDYYSFAIAETHHINYYKNIGQKDNLPEEIKNWFIYSNILFLGYSASDEFLRSFLKNFCQDRSRKDIENRPTGWLIQQSDPGKLSDEEYWRDYWNINSINYPWGKFVKDLKEGLDIE